MQGNPACFPPALSLIKTPELVFSYPHHRRRPPPPSPVNPKASSATCQHRGNEPQVAEEREDSAGGALHSIGAGGKYSRVDGEEMAWSTANVWDRTGSLPVVTSPGGMVPSKRAAPQQLPRAWAALPFPACQPQN